MKTWINTWINKICFLLIISAGLLACEDDTDQLILQSGTAPVLSASQSELVLDREEAAEEAINFTWTPATDFGFQAAVTYTLQMAKQGSNFAEPRNTNLENVQERSFTTAQLNRLALQLGLDPETSGQVEVRLRAVIAAVVDPMYSNVISLELTPYSEEVQLPSIYVAGAYQGWDPGTAAALTSAEDNGIYSGYVTFSNADDLEFKFTIERSWDENYGGEDGNLVFDGANLKVPAVGSYLISVDMNALTWTATPHSWGIIGDATAGGWDTDTAMRYDYEEGVWTVSTDLSVGEMKFRLNADWGTNYGDSNEDNETLDAGGDNIAIATAGTYTIILNLKDKDNPTYEIK